MLPSRMIFGVSEVQSIIVDGCPKGISFGCGESIGVDGNIVVASDTVMADFLPERLQLVETIGFPIFCMISSNVGAFGIRMPMVPFCITCGARWVLGLTRKIRLNGPGINV